MKVLSLAVATLASLSILMSGSGMAMTDEKKEGKAPSSPPVLAPLLQEEDVSKLPFFPSNSSLPSDINYYGITQEDVDYLFDDSRDFIALSCSGRFIKVNRAFQEATGWSEEELTDRPFIFFSHPEDIEKNVETAKIARTNISVWGFESRTRCKDNSYRWAQWLTLGKLTRPTPAPEDRIMFCIGRDITQQKEQENARIKALEGNQAEIRSLNKTLHGQNKILEAISEIQSAYIQRRSHSSLEIKSADDPIALYYKTFDLAVQYLIDLSESEFGFIGRIFYDEDGQPFIRQVFGIRENLPINEQQRQTLNMYKGEGRKLCKFTNILGDLIATKEPLIINDIRAYPKPTGIPQWHVFPINSFLGIPFIFNNEVLGIVALANRREEYNNDLLEWLEPLSLVVGRIMNEFKMEHWLEEAEKQSIARKQADASNAAKSTFLAHMSHEIRTPLTGILGFLDLINRESLSEEDCNYLKDAQASGWSLMTILNDILDASKIEANQIELEKVELNPIKIVQEVIQLLSLEAKKQGTVLATIINPATPSHLMGDPTRLRQVYFNLIG